MKRNNEGYRSAIKEKPLRRAGQSIEEELENIFDDQLLLYILGAGLSIGFILLGWVIVLLPFTLKDAVILTILGVIVEIICIRKILKVKTKVMNYREGLRGERFMGDHLDSLREKGCKVFHDFVGEYGNVDHIVVSSKGIFAIETKALKKPNYKDEKLIYNGEKISFTSGKELKNQPLDQAQTSARMIKDFVDKNIGENFWVQPIVVYPNWYIESSTYEGNKATHKVWVCNHNYLDRLINEEDDKLTKQQITVVSNKLADYIRNYERKK